MQNYKIDRMSLSEVSLALDWEVQEGCNVGLHDAKLFYTADPNGFFVGKLNNQIIATGSAVVYDKHFAFCGFYIVKNEYRGQGYGMQLTRARLDYIGERVTGINGVLAMENKYQRLGYKRCYKTNCYLAEPKISSSIAPEIISLNTVSFSDLAEFDSTYFPAPRLVFLRKWIQQPDSFALGFLDNKKLSGYGVARKCQKGFRVGPLFANSFEVADNLFGALLTKANAPVYIDIPDANPDGLKLIKKYSMQEIFSTARMYRNGLLNYDINGVYGITTLELG